MGTGHPGVATRGSVALAGLATLAVACMQTPAGYTPAGGSGGSGGAGGCVPVEESALAPLCRDDGWCWIDPFPQGTALREVAGTGPDDVWFGGGFGTVLRYREGEFSIEGLEGGRIMSLVVLGDGDVWATTYGGVFHREVAGWQEVDHGGSALVHSWRVMPSLQGRPWLIGETAGSVRVLHPVEGGWEEISNWFGYPQVVWASGPDDAWLANEWEVWHWIDGASVTQVEGARGVQAISGTAADDVWLAGTEGVWHWDGATVTPVEAPPVGFVRAAARDDVWFWGGPEVLHWDGAAWHGLGQPFVPVALWPEGEGRAWITGGNAEIARWDGSRWERLDRRLGPLASVTVDADGTVWTVGLEGRIVRIDPDTLEAAAAVPAEGAPDLTLARSRTPGDLWARAAAGDDVRTVRWDGCRWSPEPSNPVRFDAAAGTVFAAGVEAGGDEPRLLRIDATGRTAIPVEGPVTAVRALSADRALFAIETDTGSQVHRWDRGTLTNMAVGQHPLREVIDDGDRVRAIGVAPRDDGTPMRWFLLEGTGWLEYLPNNRTERWLDIWASGPDDVWFVNEGSLTSGGDLLHWDGSRLAGRYAAGADRYARWTAAAGTGPGDVWVAGTGVARWTGAGFVSLPPIEGQTWVPAIVPFPSGEAWAAGGGLRHFDGTAWGEPAAADLVWRALWASGPSDVWAAGNAGALRHFDGFRWTGFPSGVSENLVALAGTGPDVVWAAGADGALLRWNGTSWTRVLDTPHPLVAIHAVGDQVWLASSDGAVLRLDGGAVVHEELLDLEITDLIAFGAGDVWVTGQDSNAWSINFIRHWDGTAWTGFAVGLDWPELGSLVRWRDGIWVGEAHDYGSTALRELPPGDRWVQVPADGNGEVAVDRRGDLWVIGFEGNRPPAERSPSLLRYRPPAE